VKRIADSTDRLFGIVGHRNPRLLDLCPGPTADDHCPQVEAGVLPCAGKRVIPLRGTPANGLVFSVQSDERGPECPLAWVDDPSV
jgi:hypothetical protein